MDYKVRVKAVLDTASIQRQLNEISRKAKLKINTDVKGSTGKSGKGGTVGITGVAGNTSVIKKQAQAEIREYSNAASQVAAVSEKSTKRVDTGWKGIKGTVAATNNEMKYALKTQLTWGAASNVINTTTKAFTGMYDAVKQIDDSLTEMKKVMPYEQIQQMYNVSEKAASSKGMSMYLDDIAKRSKNVGLTVSDMTDATTEFIKSGFQVYSKDGGMSALDLAEIAAIYTNIADAEISTGKAAGFIISQMKVFKDVAQEPIYVLNALNEVSNTMAVSSSELQAAMQTAGSSLGNMGNSFAQTMGIVTAGIEVLRGEPNKVANGLRTIGININALAQESDEWVAANGKVRISLKDADGDIRNTYDIMKDLYYGIEGQSEAWNNLTKAERDAIGVQAAGKTRYNVFTAVMGNYESAIKAANTAQGQFGLGMSENASAIKENEEAMKSIQKHIDKLVAAWQNFSRKMLDSKWINAVLTVATKAVEFLGTEFGMATVKIGATVGALSLLAKGIGKIKNAVKGFKLTEAFQYLWSGKVPDRLKGEKEDNTATKHNTDATKRNTDALNRNTRARGGTGTTGGKQSKRRSTKTKRKTPSGMTYVPSKGQKTIKKTDYGTTIQTTKKLKKGATYSASDVKKLQSATKATTNLNKATSGLGGTLGKVGSKLKGFLGILGINPYVALAGAIVGLGVYIYQTADKFKDLQKEASTTKDELKDLDTQIEALEKKENKTKKESQELLQLRRDRAVKQSEVEDKDTKVKRAYKNQSGIGDVVGTQTERLLGNTTKAISDQEAALKKYSATARGVAILQAKANQELRDNGEVSSKTAKNLEKQKAKLTDIAKSINNYTKEMQKLKEAGQLPEELTDVYKKSKQFMDEYTKATEKGTRANFDFGEAVKNLNDNQLKAFAKKFMDIDNMSFDQIRKRMTLLGVAMSDAGQKGQDAFKKIMGGVKGVQETESGKPILDPKKLEEYAKQTDLTTDAFKNLVEQQEKAGNIKWQFDTDSLKGYNDYLKNLTKGSLDAEKGLTVSKKALQKIADETGLSKKQLGALEKQLKKTGTKVFDFGANTKTMKKQLENLKNEIGAVSDESGKIKTINFERLRDTVQQLGGTDRDLGNIVKKLSKMKDIQLTGKGAKEFVDSLQIGKTAVDELSGNYETLKKNSDQPIVMTFKADVDDTFYKAKDSLEEMSARQWVAKMVGKDEASAEVDEVMGKLRTLSDSEWKAIITGQDNSDTTVAQARARLESLVGKKWVTQLAARDGASKIIQGVLNKLAGVKDKTVNIRTNVTETFTKVFNTVSNVVKKHAHGKKKGQNGGPAWVGDEGTSSNPKPELIQTKDGAYLAGTKGWELVDLDKDDIVYSNKETKQLLKKAGSIPTGEVPRYANGSGLSGAFGKIGEATQSIVRAQKEKEEQRKKEEKARKAAEAKAKKLAKEQKKKQEREAKKLAKQQAKLAKQQQQAMAQQQAALARQQQANQQQSNQSNYSNQNTYSNQNYSNQSNSGSSGGSSYSTQKTAAEKYKDTTDKIIDQFEEQLKVLEYNKDYYNWSADTFNKKYKALYNEYQKKIKSVAKPSGATQASLGSDRYRDLQSTLRSTEREKATSNIDERIAKIGVMDNDAYVQKAIEYINKIRNEYKISAEEAKNYRKEVYKTNFDYLLSEYEDGKVSYEKMQQVMQNYYNVAGKKTADYYNMQKNLQEAVDKRYQNTMNEQTELYKNDQLSYSKMEETLKDYYKKAGSYTKTYYELEKQMQEAATQKFQTVFDKRLATFAKGESNFSAVYSVILGYINEIGKETEESKQMMEDLRDATDSHYQAKFEKQIKEYKKGNEEYGDILKTLKKYHDTYGEYTEQYYEMLEELRDTAAEVYNTQLDKQIELYKQGDWAYSNLRDVIKEYYHTVGGYTEEYYDMIDKAEEAALDKFQKQFDSNMDLYDVQRRSYKEMLTILRNYYLEVGHYTEEYYEMWEELARKAKEQEIDRLEELQNVQEARLNLGQKYIDKQIDALDDEIDKIKERNEEEEKTNELLELQGDLAKAQANRIHIYREEQGFVYERNVESIYEAQKAIDDFKKDAELDSQVKALEDMKKKWQDILNQFENSAATKEMQELLDLTGLTLQDFDQMGDSLSVWTGYIDDTYRSMADLEGQVKKLEEAITAMEIHAALPSDVTSGTVVPSANIYERPMTSQEPIIANTATTAPNYGVSTPSGNKTTTSATVVGSGSSSANRRFVLYDPKELYSDLWWEQVREQAANVPMGKNGKKKKTYYMAPSGSSSEIQEVYRAVTKAINQVNGYAKGTISAIGGLSMVGEKGRELRVLNQGDGIIPHNITENLMALGQIPASTWKNLLQSNFTQPTQTTEQNTYNNFDKLVLPNVTNGQQFINELKNLPNLALQSSTRRM